ncbi:MAG: hypothetical protein AAF614_17595 [Chloroflexota bacterium]
MSSVVEHSPLTAARIRQHEGVISELESQDAIAAEVKYHRTCFQNFTHEHKLDGLIKKKIVEEDSGYAREAQREAFRVLASKVDVDLEHPTKAVTVGELCRVCAACFEETSDSDETPKCWPHVLKARLKEHYGNRIEVYWPQKRN